MIIDIRVYWSEVVLCDFSNTFRKQHADYIIQTKT